MQWDWEKLKALTTDSTDDDDRGYRFNMKEKGIKVYYNRNKYKISIFRCVYILYDVKAFMPIWLYASVACVPNALHCHQIVGNKSADQFSDSRFVRKRKNMVNFHFSGFNCFSY